MFIIPYALTVDVSLVRLKWVTSALLSSMIGELQGRGHILFCMWGQDWQGYQIVIVNINLISCTHYHHTHTHTHACHKPYLYYVARRCCSPLYSLHYRATNYKLGLSHFLFYLTQILTVNVAVVLMGGLNGKNGRGWPKVCVRKGLVSGLLPDLFSVVQRSLPENIFRIYIFSVKTRWAPQYKSAFTLRSILSAGVCESVGAWGCSQWER